MKLIYYSFQMARFRLASRLGRVGHLAGPLRHGLRHLPASPYPKPTNVILLTQDIRIMTICRTFEHLAMFCDARIKFIPLDFMLSFFVTTVVNRWVIQFSNIGMVDQ